jgi:hypothetical protein
MAIKSNGLKRLDEKMEAADIIAVATIGVSDKGDDTFLLVIWVVVEVKGVKESE